MCDWLILNVVSWEEKSFGTNVWKSFLLLLRFSLFKYRRPTRFSPKADSWITKFDWGKSLGRHWCRNQFVLISLKAKVESFSDVSTSSWCLLRLISNFRTRKDYETLSNPIKMLSIQSKTVLNWITFMSNWIQSHASINFYAKPWRTSPLIESSAIFIGIVAVPLHETLINWPRETQRKVKLRKAIKVQARLGKPRIDFILIFLPIA